MKLQNLMLQRNPNPGLLGFYEEELHAVTKYMLFSYL